MTEEIKKAIEHEAEEYVKRQGSHDKPDITKHDFTQGYIAAYTASVQPLIDLIRECEEYLSQRHYVHGAPIQLNSIGAGSILHTKMKTILSSFPSSLKPIESNVITEDENTMWGDVMDIFRKIHPNHWLRALAEKYSISVKGKSGEPIEGGLRWVKASERMPNSKAFFVRYTDSNKKYFFRGDDFQVQIDFDGYHYNKDKVEWLDEGSNTGEWISIENRKPDHKQRVLAWGIFLSDGRSHSSYIARYYKGDEFNKEGFETASHELENVTHWRPLPKSPTK